MLAATEVVPVPCNVQTKQQNLLCSKSFETSKLQSSFQKLCQTPYTRLLLQSHFPPLSPTGGLQSVALMLSAVEPHH